MDNQGKYIELSENIMKVSRNTLIVNLRFMNSALSRLNNRAYDGTICTDGQYIYFDPIHILRLYKRAKEVPTHSYLHMVMHCVFQHFYVDIEKVDQQLWDIACDIAVEAVILELRHKAVSLSDDFRRLSEISSLKANCKYLTAEHIYRYLQDGTLSEEKLRELSCLFQFDDHSIWYDSDDNDDSDGDGGEGESDADSNGSNRLDQREALRNEWKVVSESMQTDMETFSKMQGSTAGTLMQNLASVNREKYDYTSFLKKFAVMGEAMKINDDEFDYIFYTYGMNLYDRKMPLIEPLEYKEVKRIKEFVIAIDTSGSVQGELVQMFLNKTYNILKQEESFFTKINLHIVQCDSQIQEATKITSQEEFDNYLAQMRLRGFGGTDFRPVFEYVNTMIKNKEFVNLKGLIYFTDGYGTFPDRQPEYNTAFVFIEDGYNNYDVPVWAIKLILQSNEI